MNSPTKKELLLALKDFSRAAELLCERHFIVQPFFGIYKKHGKVLSWLDKQKTSRT